MLELPTKERIDLSEINVPPKEYFDLAGKLNYNPASAIATRNARSHLELLAELNITVFPLEKVKSYLDSLYGRPRFSLKYLRKATWGWRCLHDTGYGPYNPKTNGQILLGHYTRPIPYPVLLTIRDIKQAASSSSSTCPAFAVSDVTREADFYHDPDPFLACIWSDGSFNLNIVVIERWDEPSFRME